MNKHYYYIKLAGKTLKPERLSIFSILKIWVGMHKMFSVFATFSNKISCQLNYIFTIISTLSYGDKNGKCLNNFKILLIIVIWQFSKEN